MPLYPHFEHRERSDLDFRNCESRIYVKLRNIDRSRSVFYGWTSFTFETEIVMNSDDETIITLSFNNTFILR